MENVTIVKRRTAQTILFFLKKSGKDLKKKEFPLTSPQNLQVRTNLGTRMLHLKRWSLISSNLEVLSNFSSQRVHWKTVNPGWFSSTS